MMTSTQPAFVRSLFPLLGMILCACGEPAAPGASTALPLAAGGEASADGSSGCERFPQRATRPRKVVVSHPYDESGASSNVYQVLELSEDGKLHRSGVKFRMGRLAFGRIVFTPDGQVGLAAQDDGTIGVFRFDRFGVTRVVHAGFTGAGYAASLVVDPRGDRVYALDNEWRESGGGIYSARINCDGTLSAEGQIAASKRPAGMALLPPRGRGESPRAVLAAVDVLDSAAGDNVHLLDFARWMPGAPKRVAGADGFGDDEFIVSAVNKTPDDRYVLVGDNSEFSGLANRVSVVAVEGDTLRPVQVLTPVRDPMSIVLSPFGNAGLVVSGYGNAIYRLTYDPADTTTPFSNKGDIPYVGRKPQLPAGAEMIERGSLRGRVFVAELEGVRQVQFAADGTITDFGLTSLGSDLDTIVGAVGVQP
jgi:hypothetical protein